MPSLQPSTKRHDAHSQEAGCGPLTGCLPQQRDPWSQRFAVEISHRGESIIISFSGDADETVVASIATAIDDASVAGSVLIDLSAVAEPCRTAAYLLANIDAGRIGGANIAVVCADISPADLFAHRLASHAVPLFPSVDRAVRAFRASANHLHPSHLPPKFLDAVNGFGSPAAASLQP